MVSDYNQTQRAEPNSDTDSAFEIALANLQLSPRSNPAAQRLRRVPISPVLETCEAPRADGQCWERWAVG
ncbi:hypothetical protein Mapa_002931 [Marchantia paleacea]|nr:hypothetical protein Mapa_002931 [Marchantia paleacea]